MLGVLILNHTQIYDRSLYVGSISIPLIHKYMTVHSPGLIPLIHKYMTAHSPGFIPLIHKYMTGINPGE
jgi:hypothetical protein